MNALTASALTAQLTATLPKIKGDRPLAFRCPGEWTGPTQLTINGHDLRLRECRSDLEAREAMSEVSSPSLVLLVREGTALSAETMARLAKGKLRDPDARESLLALTGAHAIDPLLLMHREVLQRLAEQWRPEVRLASLAGVIECGRAFALLLDRPALAFDAPDLTDLLRWSLEDSFARLAQAPQALKSAFFEWLKERNGPVSEPLAGAVDITPGRLVSLGLVLGTLFPRGAENEAARVRLEKHIADRHMSDGSAAAWHRASASVLERLEESGQRALMREVDDWLDELKAEPELREACAFSPRGFDARLDRLAGELSRARKSDTFRSWDAALVATKSVEAHWLVRLESPRMETIRMALRLTKWLRAPEQEVERQLGGLAALYLREHAWVDWARNRVRRGDSRESLSKACGGLLRVADERRAESNERFAEALRHWHATGEADSGMIPMERIIEEVVAPLATKTSVLLLVLDGMSGAVFAELLTDLQKRGWHALRSSKHGLPRPVIAVLPCLTKVSRAALFRGRLDANDGSSEVVNFREHPALHLHIKSPEKPALFLKPSLADGSGAGLSSDVRDAVQGAKHRVVGVVINAIDDQLSTNGQLSLQWDVNQITWLKDLLDAAVLGGRTVILMSDHGHVPGREKDASLQLKQADGDRHRQGGPPPGKGEIALTGQRLREATGCNDWIFCVSDSLRYGGKKSGYHGGAADQEVVVPLAILSHDPEIVPDFEVMTVAPPEWWSEDEPTATSPTQPSPPKRKKAAPVETPELPLWNAVQASVETPPQATKADGWISRLLASEVLAQQRALAKRIQVDDDQLAKALTLLEGKGGAVPESVVAVALGVPPFRVGGFISHLQRLLNVEGYAVVEVDSSKTVRLNRELLFKQFDILP